MKYSEYFDVNESYFPCIDESAIKAGAGWCLSFLNTATVPTIPYLEQVYGCDCTKEPVAFGSPSLGFLKVPIIS